METRENEDLNVFREFMTATMIKNLKSLRPKMLLVPMATIVGTLLFSAFASLTKQPSPPESTEKSVKYFPPTSMP